MDRDLLSNPDDPMVEITPPRNDDNAVSKPNLTRHFASPHMQLNPSDELSHSGEGTSSQVPRPATRDINYHGVEKDDPLSFHQSKAILITSLNLDLTCRRLAPSLYLQMSIPMTVWWIECLLLLIRSLRIWRRRWRR